MRGVGTRIVARRHRVRHVRRARVVAVFVMAAVGLGIGPGLALAHAGLGSSDPADGVILAAPPERILLTFTEPPDLSLSAFGLSNVAGAVSILTPEIAGGTEGHGVVLTPARPLSDGGYTVTFRAVSSTDGHVTAGSIAFGVGRGTTDLRRATATSTPPPSPSAVLGKTFLYVGLVLLVGAAGVGLLAFGGEVPGRRVLLPAAGLAAFAGALAMLLDEMRAVHASLSVVARSSTGAPFLRLLALSAVVAIVAAVAGVRSGRTSLIVTGLVASADMLARATGGHAGGRPVEVTLQWIHFVSVGVWVGGFGLLLGLLRIRRGSPPVAEARRYSKLAGYALAVVVTTGLLRTVDELGGWPQIVRAFDTSYGTTLAIKTAGVLVLIALGGLNRARAIPQLPDAGPQLLSRLVGVEIVTAVAIFAITATLTSLPPAA